MAHLNELRLDAFLTQNHHIDVQKGRYLRRWKYKIHFNGDLPRTSIKRFVSEIGAESEWTSDGHPTLYFNDILIHKMARAVADGTRFGEVMTEAEALQLDAEWQQRAEFRVLFEARHRPEVSELSSRIEDEGAELVTRVRWSWREDDGTKREHREVVAVLTNNDETMALLRLAYPGAHAESRRSSRMP